MPTPVSAFQTKSVALSAAREAIGLPSLVLFASYIGFGSLVRQSGFGLSAGLASTVTAWALPGQVALVELYAAGASVITIAGAVLLTNARLMPMVIVIMPLLRRPGVSWVSYVTVAHLVAVTSWANALRRLPDIPVGDRLRWFVAFALTLFVTSLFGTAMGFFLAGQVPAAVTLGLVFLNPIYFMLILATDLRERARALAFGFGAVSGPLLHLASPDYGLLITGVVAGSAAFGLDWLLARREHPRG